MTEMNVVTEQKAKQSAALSVKGMYALNVKRSVGMRNMFSSSSHLIYIYANSGPRGLGKCSRHHRGENNGKAFVGESCETDVRPNGTV
jgi:hypothetical protein